MLTHAVRARTLACALAAASVVTAAVWVWAPPLYLANDDVAIRMGIEGQAVPGQPATPFVLLTHSAVAAALIQAHRVFPGVPWWDLAISVVLVGALGTWAAVAWTAAGPSRLGSLAGCAALSAAAVPLLSGLQFTISATAAGGAAAALAASEVIGAATPRRRILLFAAALFLTGALIRPMGATAGAVATALMLAPAAWLAGPSFPRHVGRNAALAAAAALGGAAVVLAFDAAIYRANGAWADHFDYTTLAARLLEWGGEPSPAELDRVRAAAGWTLNDWQMLRASWGVDPALHGFDRVARAYEARNSGAALADAVEQLFGRVSSIGPASLLRLFRESAVALGVAAVVTALFARPRGLAAAALGGALFLGLCLGIEAAFKEVPFRLLAPLQVCLVVAVVLAAARVRRAVSAPLAAAAVLALLAFAGWELYSMGLQSRAEMRHARQVRAEVEAVQRLEPSLLVLHADAFPREHWWRAFSAAPPLNAVHLGYNNQGPDLQAFLSATGRQPLIRALCVDPAMLVVAQEGRLDFATAYLKEHHGMDVQWRPVFTGSFQAFRCQRR
jgi:hypothetical protein